MSRIGKKPIPNPSNVKVSVNGRDVTVESGSNKLSYTHRPEVSVKVNEQDKTVLVERHGDDRTSKAMHGLTRALIANMITGVTKGSTSRARIRPHSWCGPP